MVAHERPLICTGDSVRAILAGRKTQTRRVIKPQPVIAPDLNEANVGPAWAAGYINVRCPYGVVGDVLWVRETWAARPLFLDGVRRSEVCYAATPREGIRTPGVIRDVDRMTYLHESSPLETHGFGWPIKWRSPIFMPRWASRLALRVTEVRVQRLQEISEEDAIAEGATSRYVEGQGWNRIGWQMDWSRVGTRSRWGSVNVRGAGRALTAELTNADVALSSPRLAYGNAWNKINEKRAPWESNPYVWAVSFEVVRS